jgi:hypothetical protein
MNCNRCEDHGWLVVNKKDNSVRRCDCQPPLDFPRPKTYRRSTHLTSEGFPVATREQAKKAFEKGLRAERPDFDDTKISEIMESYFPSDPKKADIF